MVISVLAKRLFARLGYSVIPNWRMEKYELTQNLNEIFDQLDIDCVVDVGANKGQYGCYLRYEVGYQGQIISYEPVKENFDGLEAVAKKHDNWIAYNCALGKTESPLEINVMKSDDFSSFLEPKENKIGEIPEKNKIVRRETVQVRTLETEIQRLKMLETSKGVFLKMDTQGYDLEVARGANAYLQRIKGLQTEISFKNIYSRMPNFNESIDYFNVAGFDITGLFPVVRDSYGRVVEMDCVMINNKFCL